MSGGHNEQVQNLNSRKLNAADLNFLSSPPTIAPFVNPVASPQIPQRMMCATFAERMLAFASGLHPNIGSDSPVQLLTPELVRIIMAYARPPTMVTTSQDRTARVWDLETGQCKAVCSGHRTPILSVETSANRIYTGSSDTTVRVWDVKTGACIGMMRDSKHHVNALRVIRDEELLVSGSKDCHLYIYDMFSCALVNTVATCSPVYSMAYDEIARELIVGHANGTLVRYDVKTWEQVGNPILAHPTIVSLLRFATINTSGEKQPWRVLISATTFHTTTITLWNMENWTPISTISPSSDRAAVVDVQLTDFTCTGEQWILIAFDNGEIREYNALTGAFSRNVTMTSSVESITCMLVAQWRDVDLGNAWYADEAFIRDFLKPEIVPVSLSQLKTADQKDRDAAAEAEHEKEEALIADQYNRAWDSSKLGPCPVKRSARLLAVGHSDGTCSIFDYPKGSLIFTIPPRKHDEGHMESISSVTVLELDAFHDFF